MTVTAPLRIAVHDYGCYPFIIELTRELARRGHSVAFFYFAQNTTPHATSGGRGGDGTTAVPMRPTPMFHALRIAGEFRKWSFVRRRAQERAYGVTAARALAHFAPDVVLSANAPIDVQAKIAVMCRRAEIPLVFWLQDVISLAMDSILSKKIPVAGGWIGRWYAWQEARILRRSAAVVAIADGFLPLCAGMGVAPSRCHVIENWAPLSEIVPSPRHNAWSDEHDLSDKRVILYSGTLGFKHTPALFERLAAHFASEPDVRIVVVSEGPGATWLKERQARVPLDNLSVLPFQPYSRLSEVLGSGDVLLAILDEEAGRFSVPSKMLTYLAAGKPVLLSVPPTNPSAVCLQRAAAGYAVAPQDVDGLLAAAVRLLADPQLRAELGRNGRAYAERNFEIGAIADKFERILRDAADGRPG